MKKILLLVLLFLYFEKASAQMFPRIYECNDCYFTLEGGASLLLDPVKSNPGVYLQGNSNVPLVDNLLELKSGINYTYFFNNLQSINNSENTSFNIHKFGILINFDFLIKKKFIISPGADFSMLSSKILNPDNFKVGASLEAGYKLDDNINFRIKYLKGFNPVYILGNEIKTDVINLGINYAFR